MLPFKESRRKRIILAELVFVGLSSALVYLLAGRLDLFEKISVYARTHEQFEIDELFTVSLYLVICFCVLGFRWLKVLYSSEKSILFMYSSLLSSQAEVKKLQGMLPICASCKKIRDDEGIWQEIETYIHQNAQVEFTHSICMDCTRKLYPDFYPPESRDNTDPLPRGKEVDDSR